VAAAAGAAPLHAAYAGPTTKTGTVAKFSIAALVLIVAAAALLEMRRGGGSDEELASTPGRAGWIRSTWSRWRPLAPPGVPRGHPVGGGAEAVRCAGHRAAGDGPGPRPGRPGRGRDEQPHIDRYLATAPEDASILMSRPRAIREDDGASRTFVDIYRTVWRVNQELGAHRRIRIVAADLPGWPPPAPLPARRRPPVRRAGRAHDRGRHERALARNPNARVLFFVGGLHALKAGGGRSRRAARGRSSMRWLAARLAERYPHDVFSILVDATPSRAATTEVVAYRGTAPADLMRRTGAGSGFALRIDDELRTTCRARRYGRWRPPA
jgi:hypothetical protein